MALTLSLLTYIPDLPSERKKQPTPVKEVEKKDEEEWPLSEVIFVEDVKTVSIGKVLKVRASAGSPLHNKEVII